MTPRNSATQIHRLKQIKSVERKRERGNDHHKCKDVRRGDHHWKKPWKWRSWQQQQFEGKRGFDLIAKEGEKDKDRKVKDGKGI